MGCADSEVLAASPQLVVPTTCAEREGTVSEIGVLIPQEHSDEVRGQVYLGERR